MKNSQTSNDGYRAGVKTMARGETHGMGWYLELKELLLQFRGMTEKGGDPQQDS